MNLKHLIIVLVRFAAFFWVVSCAFNLVSGLSFVLPEILNGQSFVFDDSVNYWITPVLVAVGQIIAGVFMFLFAVTIGNFLCSDIPSANNENGHTEVAQPFSFSSIKAGDLYHIACFIFGVFTFVLAVSPAIRGLIDLLGSQGLSMNNYSAASNLVVAGVYVAIGLSLTLGAKGISRFIVSLGHDSEAVPNQQFGLSLILFVVVAIAIVLGVIRMMVNG